ncbi:MAG: helix-turn-helix domain-containing protein [Bacteroidota bacterium]
MSNLIPFEPNFISPPGDTLDDALQERGMSQVELAERIGLDKKTVNEIINGKAPITPETALLLERVLGIPARFWSARDQQYREALARRELTQALEDEAEWIRRFPYNDMAKLGWVEPISGRSKNGLIRRGESLLRFFGVASPSQWDQVWLTSSAAFRKSLVFASHPEPVSAWLRYGEREAEKIEAQPYDQKRFRTALDEVRQLTTESPDVFCERMVSLCAASGVAVVFTPQLPKARISGATQWLRHDLALIQLSLRHKTDDHFWFTFFHEAAHILLHGKKDVFLEQSGDESEQDKEDEANRWAANYLIPRRKMAAFRIKNDRSRAAVQSFAAELGIAPGIVVGQLQHDGFIPFKNLNDLKRKFSWKESQDEE